ncbi:MAG: glycosyltransferase involved in cell wall biosynthesis [Vicingaceae bacterium]|jgi:glycosyltransferase involved in cell wall biosynthesis
MKRILFYYPSNKRSIQIETTLSEIKKLGHEIILLTTCEKGLIHQELNQQGIKTFSHTSAYSFSPFYYLNQIVFLIRFCRKQHINLVFSNLQHTNFIAVFAQYFINARVIAFRHHFKFSRGNFGISLKVNKTEALFDKIINRLSKKIIVPSTGVYNGMKKFEKVNLKKVEIIPYLYDFSKYGSPNEEIVSKLKAKYQSELLVIMVARLIPFKRHLQMLPTFRKLIKEGIDLKVIILDEGPSRDEIEKYITAKNLEQHIFLIGFTTQFLEYMKASDILIHPSLTEASNNVVKEIGLMKKAVAVCKGVGDFDDYIIDNKNGFLMNIENPEIDAERIIKEIHLNTGKVSEMGERLNKTILATFGNNTEVVNMYKKLIENYG